MFKVLHVVKDLYKRSGGPSRSVPYLTDALSREKLKVTLLSYGVDDGTISFPTESAVHCIIFKSVLHGMQARVLRRSKHSIICLVRDADIVHAHGLWSLQTVLVLIIAIVFRKPYVLHTRGMLSKAALRHKFFKKRLAWLLYQKYLITKAEVIYATSRLEQNDIFEMGFTGSVKIVSNNTGLPFSNNVKEPIDRESKLRRFLFIGRLNPIKGLENLLLALQHINSDDWRLTIAGPSTKSFRTKLKNLVKSLELGEKVKFLDEVDEKKKKELYNDHDIFILPSLSENYGVVVEEALCANLPVITTTGTPWDRLSEFDCGWYVGTEPSALATGISAAIKTPMIDLVEMGRNGAKYMEALNRQTDFSRIVDDYRNILEKNRV